MYYFASLSFIFSHFFASFIYGMSNDQFDEKIYKQASEWYPALADNFYCQEIPELTFLEFLEIYKNRPSTENKAGLQAQDSFLLWYLLREIQPVLVVESDQNLSQTTWIIEQAAPKAKIIATNHQSTKRKYKCKKASYIRLDFSKLEFNHQLINGPVVCFFGERENAFERITQAHEKKIKYLIFQDSFSTCLENENDIQQLSLSNCLEMQQSSTKGETLRKLVKNYYIMPQIIRKTASPFVCNEPSNSEPAIWQSIHEVDPAMRSAMSVFARDTKEFRWITFVELY
jgi:hypothetical protein